MPWQAIKATGVDLVAGVGAAANLDVLAARYGRRDVDPD